MSNPYTQYQKKYTSGGGDNLFVRLQDGDKKKFRILSEAFYNLNEFTNPDGEVTVSDRYAWVVWDYEEERCRIFNVGKMIFNAVADLASDDDWGDPMTYDIKVERAGSGLETRYTVLPGAKSDPTDEMTEKSLEVDITKIIKGAISIEQRMADDKNNKSGVEEFFNS